MSEEFIEQEAGTNEPKNVFVFGSDMHFNTVAYV